MSAIKVILVCLNIFLGLMMLIAVGGSKTRGGVIITGIFTMTAVFNVMYLLGA